MTRKISKTELMERVAKGELREVFEHSTMGMFDITAMIENCQLATIVTVELSQIIQFIQTNRIVERERVEYLKNSHSCSLPGIIIHCKDGTTLIVDGHHRAIARHEKSEQYMLFWLFDEGQIMRPEHIRGLGNFEWGDKTLVNGKIVDF